MIKYNCWPVSSAGLERFVHIEEVGGSNPSPATFSLVIKLNHMFLHRTKIILSLILSFLIVKTFVYFSNNPTTTFSQIKKILDFKPFLSQIQLKVNTQQQSTSTEKTLNNQTSFFLITVTPNVKKEPTLFQLPTTNIVSTPTEVIMPSPTKKMIYIPTATPTIKLIQPTPTAAAIFSPILSDVRPGNTMEEIFKEVSKRECIPLALLRSFQTQESGPYFSYNNPASVVKIYNTYGWWINGSGDPCYGLGYHTQTGIVPPDSVMAGKQCRKAAQPNAFDQGIMGIFQVSKSEQDAAYKYLKETFPKNYDRRVLFDNAMIFAVITKNRIGNPPSNCDDWSDEVIRIAAEKHYGSCANNYCDNIIKYYHQYK